MDLYIFSRMVIEFKIQIFPSTHMQTFYSAICCTLVNVLLPPFQKECHSGNFRTDYQGGKMTSIAPIYLFSANLLLHACMPN